MENQEFQEHILKRLQKIESEVFDGTFEQNYKTPREQAESISKGESEPTHIGERTEATARARIEAYYTNYDEGSVNSLYGSEFLKYQKETAIVQMLIERYHLEQFARAMRDKHG